MHSVEGIAAMSSSNDLKVAEKTYNSFVTMLKWVVPTTALIVFIVVLLIA